MASNGSRSGSQACMRASENGEPSLALEPTSRAERRCFCIVGDLHMGKIFFRLPCGGPVAVGTYSLPPEYMYLGRAPRFEVQGTVSLCRGRALEPDVTRKKPTPLNPQTPGHNSNK